MNDSIASPFSAVPAVPVIRPEIEAYHQQRAAEVAEAKRREARRRKKLHLRGLLMWDERLARWLFLPKEGEDLQELACSGELQREVTLVCGGDEEEAGGLRAAGN